MKESRKVAVLLFDQVNAIDAVGPTEAFSIATDEDGISAYQVVSWAVKDEVVCCESGIRLCADGGLPRKPRADILLIPGGRGIREAHTLDRIAGWLRRNHERFPRIVSVCTGAYALAESGLVDGRNVTTHWAFADDLQNRYPQVHVQSDALFLRDGRYYSSGGVTAGIDLALDLIETDLAGQAAMKVARELVVFLRRTGAQAQFSMPLQMQTASPGRLEDVCRWAANHLNEDLSVESLADRAGLSTRHFSRRFRETFGEPPATYIKRLRLDTGRTLLGQGVSISRTAHAIGFASQDGFRRAFEGLFGVSPGEYQKRFGQNEVSR